jgi:hypothetical protein
LISYAAVLKVETGRSCVLYFAEELEPLYRAKGRREPVPLQQIVLIDTFAKAEAMVALSPKARLYAQFDPGRQFTV